MGPSSKRWQDIVGQTTAVLTLERALRAGKLHHALRFEGPPGVGKETTAWRLAQALVCTSGDPLGCGACSACQRAIDLSDESPAVPLHPDVILLQRGLYPPTLLGGKSEVAGISVEQIRSILLPRLGFPPHEGRALVIIVRDADELTTSAANALLKTLEEPPAKTHFILLTTRPGRLLDTIRSRTLPVRFGPLPLSDLAALLERQGVSPEIAPLAGGSLERARELAEPEARAARDAFVAAVDRAITAEHDQAALDLADERPEGRAELTAVLGHLASVYAERARELADLPRYAHYHEAIERSLRDVESNASPALLLEALLLRLRGLHRGAPLLPQD